MSAIIVSIRCRRRFIYNYRKKWDSRLMIWRRADIKRGGGWLRGNRHNLRPHRHPLNVAHIRWYAQLEQAYSLKVRIDLITTALANPYF